MTDTPSTWDGIVVNFDNLEGYAWYNTIITVNSNPYRLLLATWWPGCGRWTQQSPSSAAS